MQMCPSSELPTKSIRLCMPLLMLSRICLPVCLEEVPSPMASVPMSGSWIPLRYMSFACYVTSCYDV